jgi:hypothetical protein
VRSHLLAGVVSALAVGALVTAAVTPADAEPRRSGDYGAYPNEGKYPEQTGVKFRRVATRTATHNGRLITLKLFYNGRVGAFARIDNAPRDCMVMVDRTPGSTQEHTGAVGETVDPGLSFAYTRIANNLDGRLARGALVCGDLRPDGNGAQVLVRTNYF